jgi:hypothetical protein
MAASARSCGLPLTQPVSDVGHVPQPSVLALDGVIADAFEDLSGRSGIHPTQPLGSAPMNDRFGETVPLVRTGAMGAIRSFSGSCRKFGKPPFAATRRHPANGRRRPEQGMSE